MVSRRRTVLLLLLACLILAGCDPEELIKKKVPQPLKDALTFGPSARPLGKAKEAPKPELEILQPKNKATVSAGEPVSFMAKAKLPGDKPVSKDTLSWKLVKKGVAGAEKIGAGTIVKAQLEPGDYRVELTMTLPEPMKGDLVRKAEFRVAYTSTGKVVYQEKGLHGVNLLLTDFSGKKEISRTVTGKDGVYVIEIPGEGSCKLTPTKEGFSFFPLYMVVEYTGKPEGKPFGAVKSEMRNIQVTGSKDDSTPRKGLCPGKEAYLKLELVAESKLTSLRAELLPMDKPQEKGLVIGEALDAADLPGTSDEGATQFMKVKLPDTYRPDSQPQTYVLIVTAGDQKGNFFSGQASGSIVLDAMGCLTSSYGEALAMQEKGELAEALKLYGSLEDQLRHFGQVGGIKGFRAKKSFNNGLAHLEVAFGLLAKDAKDAEADRHLSRAVVAFSDAISLDASDAQAKCFRAVSHFLKKALDRVLDDCAQAIRLAPKMAEAYELRARTYLATQLNKNLQLAVDEFTAALEINPDNEVLRKARSETLKLDLENQEKAGNAVIDTKSVSLEDIGKSMGLRKAIRK